MYFYPRNRFLHVEVPEEKAEDNVSSTLGGLIAYSGKKIINKRLDNQ